MNLLSLFHLGLLCFPQILLGLDIAVNYVLPKYIVAPILFLYYLVPITWSLNKNECPLSNIEKNDDKEIQAIFEKFPSAPFLPLHFNSILTWLIPALGIQYNNTNMERIIVGWNVIDFIIIWYYATL